MAGRVVYAGPSELVYAIISRELCSRGFEVAKQVQTVSELISYCGAHPTDVVVTDLELGNEPVEHGVIAAVHASGARVLLLCGEHDAALLATALFAGASGYLLLRDATPEELVQGVEAVAKGDAVLHPAVAAAIVEQWRRDRADMLIRPASRVELAARELDVLAAMVDGLPTKAIARRLDVSTKTIESHKTRIYSKLGVKNQAQAVAVAIESRLLDRWPGPITPIRCESECC